jgi:hypothetical protein
MHGRVRDHVQKQGGTSRQLVHDHRQTTSLLAPEVDVTLFCTVSSVKRL